MSDLKKTLYVLFMLRDSVEVGYPSSIASDIFRYHIDLCGVAHEFVIWRVDRPTYQWFEEFTDTAGASWVWGFSKAWYDEDKRAIFLDDGSNHLIALTERTRNENF